MAEEEQTYDFPPEKKWQEFWERENTFRAEDHSEKPNIMLWICFCTLQARITYRASEGYVASDILARYKKACGFNVLHPMGWDAFGLPAEQYAIKTGTHLSLTTQTNVDNFRRQIKSIGFAIDWEREINTTDPCYYQWTQRFSSFSNADLHMSMKNRFGSAPIFVPFLPMKKWWTENPKWGNHPVERRNLRQVVLR